MGAVLGSHCDNQDLIPMSRSLHDAILSKNEEEVVTRLNMGEDVNQSHPPRYSSPLHTAVYSGNAGVVELLLCRGADPSMGDREGVTPLAIAISQNRKDIVTIISKAGGSKTPSSLPAVDDKPDPLFTHPPPWKDQTITQVQNKETVESVKPKESLYGFLKKGTKVMSSKPITTVSDSSKKPSLEINSKEEGNIKIHCDNSTVQDAHLNLTDKTKIPTCQKKEREESGHIEILKEESTAEINGFETTEEKKSSHGKYEKYKIANIMGSTYASLGKMSRKKSTNQDDIKSEHQKRKNIKLDNLVENISLRLSKGNKETKVTIDDNEIDHKTMEISTSIDKFKGSFLSVLNKQTIKKDIDSCSSKLDEEKIIETKQEDPSRHIAHANGKNLNITNKLKTLKAYKPKLFMNKKSNKQEEKIASTEKEATIGMKIKKLFESSKSKVTKNKKDRIEESNDIKPANKIDGIRKKCSTVFKNDDHDKKHESGYKKNIREVSKASATLKTFQLKLSNKGRTKKEGKENGGQISTDKSLQSQVKKDLIKGKFSNIFSKGKETKKENEASKVTSINIEKRIMSKNEIQMRKKDTKFQWIMIDGQWRKSESLGVE